jgi:hypothetical protein
LVETVSVEMPLIELIAHGKSANFNGTNCNCQSLLVLRAQALQNHHVLRKKHELEITDV